MKNKRKTIALVIIFTMIANCVLSYLPFGLGSDLLTNIFAEEETPESADPEYTVYDSQMMGTLQELIDTISQDEGENYSGTILFTKDYEENINIAPGTNIILDLNGHTLKPADVTAGYANNIFVYGNLIVKNGTLDGQRMENDRAINISSGGSVVVKNCTIQNYTLEGNGAGVMVAEKAYFTLGEGSVITNNHAVDGYGGGVYVYNAVTSAYNTNKELVTTHWVEFDECEISENTAAYGGGVAIYKADGSTETEPFEFKNAEIKDNYADFKGGGIYISNTLTLSVSGVVSGNIAGESVDTVGTAGGGIYFDRPGTLLVSDGEISGNEAYNGGGVYMTEVDSANGSVVRLNNATVSNNTAGRYGGGIYYSEATPKAAYLAAEFEAKDSFVFGNTALDECGGGVYTYNRTKVDIDNTKVYENAALKYGGGLYLRSDSGNNISTININNSEIYSNYLNSEDNTRNGGGIYIHKWSKTTITNCNFHDNYNTYYGAGLYTSSDNTIAINDSIFEKNILHANSSTATGGAMYITGTSYATLNRVTVKDNGSDETANSAGGIYLGAGTHEITDCIIDGNTSMNSGSAGMYLDKNGYLTIGGSTEIKNNKILGTGNQSGGGIGAHGTSYLTLKDDTTIFDNYALYRGGGVSAGYVTIQDRVVIKNNTATNSGGALNVSGQLTMTGGTIEDNYSSNGGGIYSETTNMNHTITGGIIRNNTAVNNGGGLEFTGGSGSTLTLSDDVQIYGNTANYGGGIYIGTATRLVVNAGTTITNNTANIYGGGIQVYYKSRHSFADSGTYTLEINGGTVKLNDALRGRDVYVEESYNKDYVRPYYHLVAAKDMEGATEQATWADELNGTYISDYIDNKTYIDGLLSKGDTTGYQHYYTFTDALDIVAQIGTNKFTTVQAAVDYVRDNNLSKATIVMIHDSYEDVTVYDDLEFTLDLNGKSIYGRAKSVFTVLGNVNLTIQDSSGDNSGKITGGHGTTDRNGTGTTIYGGGIYIKGRNSIVTLDSGTICDNTANYGSGVYVGYASKFVMNDGVIEENGHPTSKTGYEVYGAVCVNHYNLDADSANTGTLNTTFVMNGGKIINNRGVAIESDQNYAQIEINGGEISGNKSSKSGAAIRIERGAGTGVKSLYIKDAVIKNNMQTGTESGGAIYINIGDNVSNIAEIRATEISGNTTSAKGGAIYLKSGRQLLDDGTVITGNLAKDNGGGIYVEGNRLLLYNAQIYNNTAQGYAKDLYLNANTYFENDTTKDYDSRAVVNMGLEKYDCWYSGAEDVYYVEKSKIPASSDFSINNFISLFYTVTDPDGSSYKPTDGNFNKVLVNTSLTTAAIPSADNAVAKIIQADGEELFFPTLSSAIVKAQTYTDSAVVEIELLRDTSESIIVSGSVPVNVELAGHTITAPESATAVFYVNGGYITLSSSDEFGTATITRKNTDELSSDVLRAIYIAGGSVNLGKNLLIDGFKHAEEGGAIFEAWGATINGVAVSSELYIDGTTITNCRGSNGGAICVKSSDNNSYQVFEMRSGQIKNCYASIEGGAIYIKSEKSADHPTYHIIGGEFNNNYAVTSGGAIYVNSTDAAIDYDDVQIYGVHVHDNESNEAGGIRIIRAGTKEMPAKIGDSEVETIIENNYAKSQYGGILYASINHPTYVEIENVTIQNNEAKSNYGGGNIEVSSLIMHDCLIKENTAVSEHGGLKLTTSIMDAYNCEFVGNKNVKGNYGGALFVTSNESIPDDPENGIFYERVLRDSVIKDNEANYAPAVYWNTARNFTLRNVEVCNNKARNSQGAFCFAGNNTATVRTYLIDGCNIHDNSAVAGNGVFGTNSFDNGTIIFKDTTITGNTAKDQAVGSISPYSATRPINFEFQGNNVISNNVASNSRGGLYLDRLTSIKATGNTEISYNTATKGDWGGIHIYSKETYNTMVDLDGMTFRGNYTKGKGAGLGIEFSNTGTSVINITNCTFEDNDAAGNGAGLYINGCTADDTTGPKLNIAGSVFRNNIAGGSGGAIYNNQGAVLTHITNSVITGNTAATNGGGIFVSSLKSKVTLGEGGKLYGNKAFLGQDIYIDYNSSYKTSSTSLIAASSMFTKDEMTVKGWYNETTGKITLLPLEYNPATQALPITLSYAEKKPCAIYNKTIYMSVQEAIDALSNDGVEGTVYLIDDCAESIEIVPGSNMTLNLNGYTLSGSGASAITVKGNVRIVDEDPDSAEVTVDGTIYQSKVDENNVRAEGTITGIAAVNGGGVNVSGGTAVLESGKISGCQAGSKKNDLSYGGAGVYVSAGTFTLAGTGKICDNTAYHSSAVLVSSSAANFIMQGGEICNNTATSKGTITNKGGYVKIYGGSIHDNTTVNGGAIYNDSGSTFINGTDTTTPEIYNNIGTERGGAIYVGGGSVQVGKSNITKNKTTKAKSATIDTKDGVSMSSGGAIYVDKGTLDIIEGAYIAENSAVRGGGIFQTGGTVNIMGGTITKNTAQLGGGIAQNPFPGNATTSAYLSKGAVYANASLLTSFGNDIYSAYEGTNVYPECLSNKNDTPKFQILAASDMGVADYNVWRDDTYTKSNPFYTGDEHDGTQLGDGQFVTEKIIGTNLQLTADYRSDYNSESANSTIFEVSKVTIEQKDQNTGLLSDGMTTGSANFDDGKNGFDDASVKEVTAEQLLEKLNDTSVIYDSDKTYVYNGTAYKYIIYNGKEYERDQMVEWWPGDDYNATNTLVRSFDSVVYSLFPSIEKTGTEVKDSYTYNVWVRAVLPVSSDEAEFDVSSADITGGNGMSQYVVTNAIIDGKECQILEGFWERTVDNENIKSSFSRNIVINVHGMKNEDTFKPTFEMWVEGNKSNEETPAACESKTITVSSAPKFNISIDTNSTLGHEGYFDVVTGMEVSEKYKGPNPTIYGMIVGYGITVSMYNEPGNKKLKGLEYPERSLEFDLSLKGEIYVDGKLITTDATIAPYIWAYKENVKSDSGKELGDTSYDRNMNWNDEDDLESEKTTSYAYNAAPFNMGNDGKSCYNGGNWMITGTQPENGDSEVTVHVKVEDYIFETGRSINTDYDPSSNSDGVKSSVFGVSEVKPFTAGYVQVLLPVTVDKKLLNGDVQVATKAVATNLKIKGLSGKAPEDIYGSALDDDKMLKNLKVLNDDYFGLDDSYKLRGKYADYPEYEALAVNERRYTDNYCQCLKEFYVANGDGDGSSIEKHNYFKDHTGVLFSEAGDGETPLNSYVYVNSQVDFSSQMFYTNDPEQDWAHYYINDDLYHSDNYTELGTEYNYVTALNILQKFDANAYTPVNTEAIINQSFEQKSQSGAIKIKSKDGDDAFSIRVDDEKIIWTNDPITWKYDLTVLYAAKPDGSNWTYADVSDDPKYYYEGHPSDPGTYNDGGVAEMDQYREENLIYFETMEDLLEYFGEDEDGNPKGVCVGILYEFRNCCLRSGRSITADALLKVTGDFERTGQTYCTTNDVKAWYTYRPHYKYYYKQMNGTSLKDHLYGFNWTDVSYTESANGVTPYGKAYGAGVSYTTDSEFANWYNQVAKDDENDNVSGKYLGKTNDGYEKTQYRNGSMIAGTHTGARRGNSLLLYTMDTNIEIYVADYVEGSNNTVRKTNYDISNGERTATFEVNSYMEISSAAKKTELVENGSLSTVITIEFEIPKDLTYKPGSLVYKYANDDGTPLLGADGKPRCYYNEGDLNWGTPIIETLYDDKGNEVGQKVTLSTFVSNIDMGLPDIYFSCDIGDLYDKSKDITQNGSSYSVKARIYAEYEEKNISAAESEESSTDITILITNDSGVSKDVDKSICEVGDDFTYKLSYSNNTNTSASIETMDILPYNGDGRATSFTGGYRVKTVTIRFTDLETYGKYKANPVLKYKVGQKNVTNINTLTDMQTSMRTEGSDVPFDGEIVWDDANMSATFIISDNADMIQLAYNPDGTAYDSGILLYTKYDPGMKSRVYMDITLSPLYYGGDGVEDLIVSGTKEANGQVVQTGLCIYENTFSFRNSDEKAEISNKVLVNTANRVISGTVWMDQNQNGLYDSQQIRDVYEEDIKDKLREDTILEYPISGVDVTLYEAIVGADGGFTLGNVAVDILGNKVEKIKTDKEGKYIFENLREGTYVVVFTNPGDDYKVETKAETEGATVNTLSQHPIEFNRLSVANNGFSGFNNGNKSKAIYNPEDNTWLSGAMIISTAVMPSLEAIQYGPYVSANWNLGLYYDEILVDKAWKNFRDPEVDDGTYIIYDITGKISGHDESFYTGELIMKYENGEVAGRITEKEIGQEEPFSERDLEVEVFYDSDERTKFYWRLKDNIILQAATEEGVIKYSFTERGIYDKNDTDNSGDYITKNDIDRSEDYITENQINGVTLKEDLTVSDIEIIEDASKGYFSFRAENTKKEYFLSIEKIIYVDKTAHGKNADDKAQQFVFKIERFENLEDLQYNENVQETFYSNLNCTDSYVPTVTENYVDRTVIDVSTKKVKTPMEYQYEYAGYMGKEYIMVTEPGWYKITEMSNWSGTDYEYVVSSNTYLNGVKNAMSYVDYKVDKSNGYYVAFDIGETYNGDLAYSEFPTARFTNIESDYAYRSSQAYAENNIEIP